MIGSTSANLPSTVVHFIHETFHKAITFESLLLRIKSRTPQRGIKELLDTAHAISQTVRASLEMELAANPQFSEGQVIDLCTRRQQLVDSIHEIVFEVIQPTEYSLYPTGIIEAAEHLIKEIITDFALVLNPYSGNTYKITAYPNLLDLFRTSLSPYVKDKSEEERKLPEWIVILSYPAVQSTNVLLHSIMVGHELVHLKDHIDTISSSLVASGDVRIIKAAVRRESTRLGKGRTQLFEDTEPILRQWLSELVADLIAVRVFGPTYLFSFASLSLSLEVIVGAHAL